LARRYKTVDYEQSGHQTFTIDDVLPEDHLARFIIRIVAMLDLSAIYGAYGTVGGEAYAPEVLWSLLLYGYVTGVFSSRQLEQATYEVIPFRFIAGGMHPDHDTVAHFRKRFLAEIKALFVQVLVMAQQQGYLKLGQISVDGSKIHADASKSHAVSWGYLPQLEQRLAAEVAELMDLAEQADQGDLPAEMNIAAEIAFRQERLVNLARARAVLVAREQQRYPVEQAEYEAKMQARAERARQQGHRPRGRAPKPPVAGPRAKDQYNFTDPASAIMKNSNNDGFDQHYNAQAAVKHTSRLIVANTLSAQPVDTGQAIPTVEAIPTGLGQPKAAALDRNYFSPANIEAFESRGIEPYIATGREPHQRNWKLFFGQVPPEPPGEQASLIVKMAYKLRTELGQAIYRLRKSTVEPVIGIIKETLGFRQFSLGGLEAAAGEWNLVCLAYNLKRLHILMTT
jgi:transposase